MSLVYGGLFDYENNWVADHAEHRDGKQADVASIKGLNPQGSCTDIVIERLRKSTGTIPQASYMSIPPGTLISI
jgi:hypothetical protein